MISWASQNIQLELPDRADLPCTTLGWSGLPEIMISLSQNITLTVLLVTCPALFHPSSVVISHSVFSRGVFSHSSISEQQMNNPDGSFIISGDFNHANLKEVLLKFYKHLNFATRRNNTLDLVYTMEGKMHTRPRVLGSYFCYANSSIQTTSQPCQTCSKVHHSVAKWCYFNTRGPTGTCSKRQPTTPITQTFKNTLIQWLLIQVDWWCDSHQDHPHMAQDSC